MQQRFGSPAAIACALLWGFQFALLVPVVAILLVQLHGATPAEVGGLMAASNAVAFVLILAVPRYADRTGDYVRPMAVAGVAGVALALTFALAPSLVFAGIGMVAFTGLAGVGMPLYWGYLRSGGAAPAAIIRLRSLFSVAWVAGPPLATLLLGAWGPAAVVLLVAGVSVGALAASVWLVRPGLAPGPLADDDAEPVPVPRLMLTVALVAFTLLQATNTAAVSTMTLMVTDHLGLDVVWAGVALGLAAGLEVPAFLVVGRLVDRLPTTAVVALGCLAGVLYYAGMVVASGPLVLLALQVLNAFFYAVVAGVGLTWFQDMVPGASFAAGLFANTNRVGAIVSGGLVAVASVSSLGYGAVFAASAVVCVLAMAIVLAAGRRHAA